MDWIILVVLTLAICDYGTSLDFSQFYLPPCCYISPQGDHFSGYASPSNKESSNSNSKRQVNSFDNVPLVHSDSKIPIYTANEVHTNYRTKESRKSTKKQVFSLVVPLDETITKADSSYSTTEFPETTQLKPPTTGKILLPARRNMSYVGNNISKFKRDSNPGIDKTKLLEEVITLELEDESRNSPVGKKSLMEGNYYQSSILLPEHRGHSDHFAKKYESWEPKKFRGKVTTSRSKSLPIRLEIPGKHDHLMASANSVKQQAVRKMPASWQKNLKRAIYQSIAAHGKRPDSNQEVPFHDRDQGQSSPRNSILYPEMWKSIQNAKLQYIDKMSKVASDINSAIFLPQGQGPVVSGVLVNTVDGGLQLRVASELYTYDGSNDVTPGCHCYLVSNGDILVSYWSVSRIFNENGQPALQYLIYPLPFSVPTPPDYIPFSNDPMFRPSQIDPLSNYYEQIHRTKYNRRHQNQMGNIPEGVIGHVSRNPKLVHELPNDHHQIEPHNLNIPIPSPIPNIIGQRPEDLGVLIQKNGQYTPEFVELYHNAVQHHLQQQDQHVRPIPIHDPPFPNIVHDRPPEGPGNYEGPPEGPGNYEGPPLPIPIGIRDNPVQFVQPTPVFLPDPTEISVPVLDDQLSKPPTYPNSIQDIISPFPQPLPGSEFGPELLDQVRVQQPGSQEILEQLNPGTEQHGFLNQNPIPNQPQNHNEGSPVGRPYQTSVQSTGMRSNKNKNNNVNKNNDLAYYDDKRQGDDNAGYSQRPFTVSNVLDNERKYYPRRKPSNDFVNDFSVSKSPYRRKPIQRIDNAKGYILDF